MKQLRPPPAYNVYASDDLASSRYYGLSVGERGLLDSMNRAWWVERHLPRNPILLARVVRLDTTEVEKYLTPSVLRHFVADEVVPDELHSVELQRQFNHVLEIREKQAIGGKIGAQKTNDQKRARRKPKQDKPSDDGTSTPASQGASTPASQLWVPERTELQRTELQSLKEPGVAADLAVGPGNGSDFINGAAQAKSPISDFVRGYELAESTAEEYRRRSRGE